MKTIEIMLPTDFSIKHGGVDVFIPYPFDPFDKDNHRARRRFVAQLCGNYKVEKLRRAFYKGSGKRCALFITVRPLSDGPPVEYWVNYSPLQAMRTQRGERVVQHVTREDVMPEVGA